MVTLRWRMIALTLWLALLFNIERVNLGSEDTLNLPTATYVVGLLSAVASLLLSGRPRSLPGVVAATVAGYALLLFLVPGPDLGGMRTYMSLAGLLLALVTTLLAHLVAEGLAEFHRGVESVVLAGAGPPLMSLSDAGERLEVELDRTRRIERPITVVKLRIDSAAQTMLVDRFIAEITRGLVQRYATTAVAQVVGRRIRRNNFVVADKEPGQLLIIAPETSAEQVPVMVERVEQAVRAQFGFEPQLAHATLPTDALTFSDLHAVVEGRLAGEASTQPVSEVAHRETQSSTD